MAKIIPKIESVTIDVVDTINTSIQKISKNAFDDYIRDIKQRASDLISIGTDPEVVKQILLDDIKNNTGEFKKLSGTLNSVIDEGINKVSNFSSQEPIRVLSNRFKWIYEPGVEHCQTCIDRNNDVRSYEEWEDIGLPGAGTTVCKIYCKCTLWPVTVEEDIP